MMHQLIVLLVLRLLLLITPRHQSFSRHAKQPTGPRYTRTRRFFIGGPSRLFDRLGVWHLAEMST